MFQMVTNLAREVSSNDHDIRHFPTDPVPDPKAPFDIAQLNSVYSDQQVEIIKIRKESNALTAVKELIFNIGYKIREGNPLSPLPDEVLTLFSNNLMSLLSDPERDALMKFNDSSMNEIKDIIEKRGEISLYEIVSRLAFQFHLLDPDKTTPETKGRVVIFLTSLLDYIRDNISAPEGIIFKDFTQEA